MKFNKIRTRRGKLERKITLELNNPNPNVQNILSAVEEFEKNNLDTIDKLKREKTYDSRKISGALKSCIIAHGPITKLLIGSATKRIHGSLLEPKKGASSIGSYSPTIIKILKILAWIGLAWIVINFMTDLIK